MGEAMATRKITIEVEVPEGLEVDEDKLARIARAVIFELATKDIARLLRPSSRDVEEIIEKTRRGLRSPHQ